MKLRILRETRIDGVKHKPGDIVETDQFKILIGSNKAEKYEGEANEDQDADENSAGRGSVATRGRGRPPKHEGGAAD